MTKQTTPFLRYAVRSLCVATLASVTLGAAPPKLSALVDAMPHDSHADARPVYEQMLQLGPDGLAELCAMLIPPGTGDDTKARFALGGLSFHVARPGAEAERKLLVQAYLAALAKADNSDIKSFFLTQFRWCGGPEIVKPVSSYLADADLCEPATFALLNARPAGAEDALLTALRGATGKNVATLAKALGELRAKSAVAEIAKHAGTEDRNARLCACYALANIADPASRKLLAERIVLNSSFERSRATADYILFAQRLAEDGNKPLAGEICRELINHASDRIRGDVKSSALSALTDVDGMGALPELLIALDSEDAALSGVAARLMATKLGPGASSSLIAEFAKSNGVRRARLADVLGRRRDPIALSALTQVLGKGDELVRVEIVRAIGAIGGVDGARALVPLLGSDLASEAEAAFAALQDMGGKELSALLTAALAKAADAGVRARLIDLLAGRMAADDLATMLAFLESPDGAVRAAALAAVAKVGEPAHIAKLTTLVLAAKTDADRNALTDAILAIAKRSDGQAVTAPLVEAMAKATPQQAAAIIGVLGKLGGEDALSVVAESAKSGQTEIRDAAIRALSSWPDDSAVASLLDIAAKADTLVHKVLALRGLTSLLKSSGMGDGPKLKAYKQAFDLAERPDEKKLVLSGLGAIPTAQALAMAASALDDPALKTEAALTVSQIVASPKIGRAVLVAPETRAVLEKAVEAAPEGKPGNSLRALLDAGPGGADPNLAWQCPVLASRKSEGANVPERAVDGDLDNTSGWWGNGSPGWLQVDLQKDVEIDAVRVYFYAGDGRYYQYKIETSVDGKEWHVAADASKSTDRSTTEGRLHEFTPVKTRFVRVNVLKNSSNPSIHLREVKVYAKGTAPLE